MKTKKMLGASLAIVAGLAFAALPLTSIAGSHCAKTSCHCDNKCKSMHHCKMHNHCKMMMHNKCKGMNKCKSMNKCKMHNKCNSMKKDH